MHGFLVGDDLAYERLAVYRHNLVASQQAGLFGRSVLYHILHVYGVISDHKLDAHTAERSFQVVGGSSHILGTDVNGVWVQLREDERYRLVYQRVDIHRIHILVVDDVQQVVEPVASAVDDIEPVS